MPIILMTSKRSEEIGIQRGAKSFVPKRHIERQKDILPQVLARAKTDRRRQKLNQFVECLDYQFILENDPLLVESQSRSS